MVNIKKLIRVYRGNHSQKLRVVIMLVQNAVVRLPSLLAFRVALLNCSCVHKRRNYLQDGQVGSTKRIFEKAQVGARPGFFPGRASV